MTFDRDGKNVEGRENMLAAGDSFDEALNAFAAEDDDISTDDANASIFLERFPVGARERSRPEDR